MARLPRYSLPGVPQHVIQRGNNREIIFAHTEDYSFYLEKLGEALDRYTCQLHAYVLMTNHVHLLITPKEENGIGKVMQSLGRTYVQYFNYVYSRTGTLWEGRYKATLLNSDQYLLTCMRYIELNPIRANMVKHPSEYPYSSYRTNAVGKENPIITPHKLYQRLGKTPEQRQQSYRALFKTKLDERTLEDLRTATNKAWVLGDDRFKDKIEKLTQRQTRPKARGGDHKSEEYWKQHG
jgi:putative transposase